MIEFQYQSARMMIFKVNLKMYFYWWVVYMMRY